MYLFLSHPRGFSDPSPLSVLLHNMDALCSWMVTNRFQQFLNRSVDTMGVEFLADLALITTDDLYEKGSSASTAFVSRNYGP